MISALVLWCILSIYQRQYTDFLVARFAINNQHFRELWYCLSVPALRTIDFDDTILAVRDNSLRNPDRYPFIFLDVVREIAQCRCERRTEAPDSRLQIPSDRRADLIAVPQQIEETRFDQFHCPLFAPGATDLPFR